MSEHTKLYGICENKCLVEVYSAKKIDEIHEELKKSVSDGKELVANAITPFA